ncbi:MAG: hypothetical protein QXT85_02115 [Nanopusillaceae archaeon]
MRKDEVTTLQERIYLQRVFEKLLKGKKLSYEVTKEFFKKLLLNVFKEKNDATLGAFLAILTYRTPSKEELRALFDVLLETSRVYKLQDNFLFENAVTIIGSGRDTIKTFNISTAAAFVAATAGAFVAKPGSRSETNITGTTDIFEMLGININCPPPLVEEIMKETRIGFFNSELLLPDIFSVYIGKIVFFNPLEYVLGIFNGIKTKRVVFGISNPKVNISATFLKSFGIEKGIVICGCIDKRCSKGYIDEASVCGPTYITEINKNKMFSYKIFPEDLGIRTYSYKDILTGKTKEDSLDIFLKVLSGKSDDAKRDIVALNSALILHVSHLNYSIKKGFKVSQKIIDSGKALETVEKLKIFSKRCKK